MITRVMEDFSEVKARFNEKAAELNAYYVVRDEYENILNTISKIIQLIETKTQQSQGIDLRQNLDLFKVRKLEIVIIYILFPIRI
jgi:hypothetical protein